MSLERYWIGATFSFRKVFEICYDLSLILKIRKTEKREDMRIDLKLTRFVVFGLEKAVLESQIRLISLPKWRGVDRFGQTKLISMIFVLKITPWKNGVCELPYIWLWTFFYSDYELLFTRKWTLHGELLSNLNFTGHKLKKLG